MDGITTGKLLLVICADPLNERRPDAHFAAEADAAVRAGFEIALFSYEALYAGDSYSAIRQIAPSADRIALLRSWMPGATAQPPLHSPGVGGDPATGGSIFAAESD